MQRLWGWAVPGTGRARRNREIEGARGRKEAKPQERRGHVARVLWVPGRTSALIPSAVGPMEDSERRRDVT